MVRMLDVEKLMLKCIAGVIRVEEKPEEYEELEKAQSDEECKPQCKQ